MNRLINVLICLFFLSSLGAETSQKNADSLALLTEKAGTSTNWCCANDLPVNTIQRTRIGKKVNTVLVQVVIGYQKCDNSTTPATNTNSSITISTNCPIYGARYRQEISYFIETYDVPDLQSCPDHQVKCCDKFVYVAGNCYTPEVVLANYDLFLSLGLIDKPLVGK